MRGFPNGRRAGCFALTQSLRSSVGRDFNRVFYQINNNSLYLVSAGAAVARLLMYNGQKPVDTSSISFEGWTRLALLHSFWRAKCRRKVFRPSVAGRRAFDLSAMR
jgi:hypothetical protein